MLACGEPDDVAQSSCQVVGNPGYVESMFERVYFAVQPKPDAASRARRFVESTLEDWQRLTYLPDALIIVTELVENVVKHAKTDAEIWLSRRPDSVGIEVSDHDTESLPHVIDHEDFVTPSGRGLRIVQNIARRWGVRRTNVGKVVWVDLDMAEAPECATS